jgi:UDP-4-amino-4,6-dideoxy-N-acetyl-beta-L-altrosamine N-acetyltransferase
MALQIVSGLESDQEILRGFSMTQMFHLHDYGLREIASHDSSVLLQWHNSDHIRAASFNDHLMTEQEHQQWFDSLKTERRSKHLIFESRQVPLGLVRFAHIEKRHNTAQWGFYLGDTQLPKGTGTVLTYFGLEYAFSELQVRKITAEVLADNSKSIRLHEKLGFVKEGHFREHIFKGGVFHDVLIFALFVHDWRANFRSAIRLTCFSGCTPDATIDAVWQSSDYIAN